MTYRIFRNLIILLTVLVLSPPALAQERGIVEGTVTLADGGNPLHGARVLIVQLSRSVLTDEEGGYRFEGVPAGEYEIIAAREHFQAARVPVTVVGGDVVRRDIALTFAAVHEDVTVTATGRETTVFDAFNSVQVLDSIDLVQKMAGSLGELLEGEPGVAKRSFGPGSSRPIIRGFDNDRVLIMQDGVPTGDLSSQSGDHGVSVDPGGLQKVEILKGPATLLYGSNAIGGVVNTITPQQQFYDNPPNEWRGQVNGDLGSTNGQAGLSGAFQYGSGDWMLWFGGGARRTGDYVTPQGEIENSASDLANGRVGGGWFGDRGWISFGVQLEDGSYGVPFAGELGHGGGHEDEGDHGDEGDHEDEVLISLDQRRAVYRLDGGLRDLEGSFLQGVKAALTFTDWHHEEIENFEATGEREVGTRFDNDIVVARVEAQQRQAGRLHGQFGVWGQWRDYVAVGEEALAPPTTQSALAAFVYEELDLDDYSLQFGARVERNAYEPDRSALGDEHLALGTIRDRSFSGLSASIGARVPLAGNTLALVANLTSAHRAPALEELYNFGPHVGNLAFEIGNPDLGAERSNGGEISLRVNAGEAHGQVNVFYYDIDGFIFGAPTGELVEGLTQIRFLQGDARFVGADLALSFHLSPTWRVHFSGGVVDAQLKDPARSLPRIPPANGRLALDWTPAPRWQVRPELVFAARQGEVFENETTTDGYATTNLLASYTIAGHKAMHVFTLSSTNLGDTLYRNHTSFIKDLAPEMGRRVMLTYALRLF